MALPFIRGVGSEMQGSALFLISLVAIFFASLTPLASSVSCPLDVSVNFTSVTIDRYGGTTYPFPQCDLAQGALLVAPNGYDLLTVASGNGDVDSVKYRLYIVNDADRLLVLAGKTPNSCGYSNCLQDQTAKIFNPCFTAPTAGNYTFAMLCLGSFNATGGVTQSGCQFTLYFVNELSGVCRPVNCSVGQWSSWSSCTRSCGTGTRTRTRAVTEQPQGTGDLCPALLETEDCNNQTCPASIPCEVSDWTAWSACSLPCRTPTQLGSQTRSRQVTVSPTGNETCPALSEQQDCNTFACPSTGDNCPYDYPLSSSITVPSGGGITFPGNTSLCQMQINDRFAPTAGNSIITVTSPLGTYPRYRLYFLDDVNYQQVANSSLPADCGYNGCFDYQTISTYNPCMQATHVGTYRTAFFCQGVYNSQTNQKVSGSCAVQFSFARSVTDCPPVDCVVSAFSPSWSACNLTCGGGYQYRNRSIIVQPSGSGAACPSLVEYQLCNNQTCPADVACTVDDWGPWSTCTSDCDIGTRDRTRSILQPKIGNGAACPPLGETEDCNTFPCTSALNPCPVGTPLSFSFSPIGPNGYSYFLPACIMSNGDRLSSVDNTPILTMVAPENAFCTYKLVMWDPAAISTAQNAKTLPELNVALAECGYENCTNAVTLSTLSPCLSVNVSNNYTLAVFIVRVTSTLTGLNLPSAKCNATLHFARAIDACPVQDCEYSDWSAWTDCSPCGNGTQYHTRSIITLPSGGGMACGNTTETQSCFSSCPLPAPTPTPTPTPIRTPVPQPSPVPIPTPIPLPTPSPKTTPTTAPVTNPSPAPIQPGTVPPPSVVGPSVAAPSSTSISPSSTATSTSNAPVSTPVLSSGPLSAPNSVSPSTGVAPATTPGSIVTSMIPPIQSTSQLAPANPSTLAAPSVLEVPSTANIPTMSSVVPSSPVTNGPVPSSVPSNWPPFTPGSCGGEPICATGRVYWDAPASPDTQSCSAVTHDFAPNFCQGYCCDMNNFNSSRAATPGSCSSICVPVQGYAFSRTSTTNRNCRITRSITATLNCDGYCCPGTAVPPVSSGESVSSSRFIVLVAAFISGYLLF